MKKFLAVSILALSASLPAFATIGGGSVTGETYVTHRGYTFTQVSLPKFGTGWKAPDGTIWSACIGEYSNQGNQAQDATVVTHSPATEACEALGASLPLIEDYSALVQFFRPAIALSTAEDAADFIRLFHDCNSPDQMPRMFWTASAFQMYARVMDGWDPFGDIAAATNTLPVRCIVRPAP